MGNSRGVTWIPRMSCRGRGWVPSKFPLRCRRRLHGSRPARWWGFPNIRMVRPRGALSFPSHSRSSTSGCRTGAFTDTKKNWSPKPFSLWFPSPYITTCLRKTLQRADVVAFVRPSHHAPTLVPHQPHAPGPPLRANNQDQARVRGPIQGAARRHLARGRQADSGV